jgi:hypothetical protein
MGESSNYWTCGGCGRRVFRPWGAAAAVRRAGCVSVRIKVDGACAQHVVAVRRLLSAHVAAGDEVLAAVEPQQLRPREVAQWAAEVRIELGELAFRSA